MDAEREQTTILVTNTNGGDIITLEAQKVKSIDAPATLTDQIDDQALGDYNKSASFNAGRAGFELDVGHKALFVWISIVKESFQIVWQIHQGARTTYLAQHILVARHRGQRQMHDTLSTNDWPHNEDTEHITIVKCESCTRNKNWCLYEQPLRLFLTSRSLYFIEMDILEPLSETNQSIQYICGMTNPYSKLIRAISMPKTSSTLMENIILAHLNVLISIPIQHLMYNRPQFERQLFTFGWGYFGVRHLTTKACYTQTKGQTEQLKRTIITRVLNCVVKYQRD